MNRSISKYNFFGAHLNKLSTKINVDPQKPAVACIHGFQWKPGFPKNFTKKKKNKTLNYLSFVSLCFLIVLEFARG